MRGATIAAGAGLMVIVGRDGSPLLQMLRLAAVVALTAALWIALGESPSGWRAGTAFVAGLGATAVGEPFDLPAQGVRVCFVDLPNAQVELIEPLGEESPIHGFLARNPAGGQHHLCFEVADIKAAVAEMTAKGAKVLSPPRVGAGALVAAHAAGRLPR